MLRLQVRKLLRTEGLLGTTRGGCRLGRRRSAAEDDEGFISDGDDAGDGADGGDVLFDVEKAELERLYQQYIIEEDYLDKVLFAEMAFCARAVRLGCQCHISHDESMQNRVASC